ncbi:glutamate--tRNA ligase [Alkalitalea saponilacus]|uniref:Glutamate--tRNA ligase n=1 Tax=Alkalitalea saponilacus TaxID=889453 RepID=A0A1T5FIX4_9BACT|nr:glutamate--tRNA ligase [Alkalitalea saponilacus]SKB96120.1 glutamyl-tRNA synthetase [Alkalitalea saponilacus]
MNQTDVRVRFAPSPTGPLHIGGVRTALFNYLFARKHGGKFILRIEDTDSTRFVPGAEEYINESLSWLGLKVDEGVREGGEYGPYKQSQRRDIYRQYAQQLIDNGWAYYAFDTPEELDALRSQYEADKKTFAYDVHNRSGLNNSLKLGDEETLKRIEAGEPYVIRFKMPENVDVSVKDIVRGQVTFNTSTLDDKVLFKSADQLPTYHLANVTDDHLMKITHVIRGEEWLPSLPLHVMLYRAFGWEKTMPEFAHLPLILKPSGKGKLSKRDGDKEGFPVFPLKYISPDGDVSAGYRESGYFPEAVNNLLVLLGWNPGTEQELFTIDELIDLFTLERVNKSGARFDPDKARWFNHQYLIKKSDAELAILYKTVLAEKGIETDLSLVEKIVGLVKERVNFVEELWEQTWFFFQKPQGYDEKVVKKRWKGDVPVFILKLTDLFDSAEIWEAEPLKEMVSAEINKKEQNFGNVMNALRLSLVGGAFGPDLFTIIEILGKKECVERIKLAVEVLGSH